MISFNIEREWWGMGRDLDTLYATIFLLYILRADEAICHNITICHITFE